MGFFKNITHKLHISSPIHLSKIGSLFHGKIANGFTAGFKFGKSKIVMPIFNKAVKPTFNKAVKPLATGFYKESKGIINTGTGLLHNAEDITKNVGDLLSKPWVMYVAIGIAGLFAYNMIK